jgi:hypothetical protein
MFNCDKYFYNICYNFWRNATKKYDVSPDVKTLFAVVVVVVV